MDIKEKQAALLDLLKKFDEFATENQIRYFVAAGTLLGAVREKGFIPWDGDVDVHIPRPDYEKCEKILLGDRNGSLGNGAKWVSYKTDKDAPNLMARIYGDDLDIDHIENYPYIDLYTIVGIPDEPKKAKKFGKKALNAFRIYWIKKRKYKNSLKRKKSKIGYVLQKLLFFYPKKHCVKVFEKLMDEVDYSSANNVVPLTGLYKEREAAKKEWLESDFRVPFEDTTVPIPVGYKEYLTKVYGEDYMTPKQFARYEDQED